MAKANEEQRISQELFGAFPEAKDERRQLHCGLYPRRWPLRFLISATAMAKQTACRGTKEVNSGQEHLATSDVYPIFSSFLSEYQSLPLGLLRSKPSVGSVATYFYAAEDMPQKERDAIMQQPPGQKSRTLGGTDAA